MFGALRRQGDTTRGRLRVTVVLALCAHGALAFVPPPPALGLASPNPVVLLEVSTVPGQADDAGQRGEVSAAAVVPAEAVQRAGAPRTLPLDQPSPAVAAEQEELVANVQDAAAEAHAAGPAEMLAPSTAQGDATHAQSGGSDAGVARFASGSGALDGNGTRGSATAARLLARGDPCPGYFPASARAARGEVRLRVDVDAAGRVTGSRVISATPRGDGFGEAALACAPRLRFVAAKTADGVAAPSRATLALHFER